MNVNKCVECGKVYAYWEQWSEFQHLYTCPDGHQWVVLV